MRDFDSVVLGEKESLLEYLREWAEDTEDREHSRGEFQAVKGTLLRQADLAYENICREPDKVRASIRKGRAASATV